MAQFQVQLWPDGRCDERPFQRVEAQTPQEAAEKLYGRPLKRIGKMAELRARVHDAMTLRQGTAKVFFDASA